MAFFRQRRLTWALLLTLTLSEGCRLRQQQSSFKSCGDERYRAIATQVEYPEVTPCSATDAQWAAVQPVTLTSPNDIKYWDLSLQEAVTIALTESRVIRDLGGTVLRTPAQAETYWDPATVETDPRFGVDAALSAFDAQLTSSVFGFKNDRALNNEFFGGGTRLLQQDLAVFQTQIAKKAATGSRFAMRHYTDYDSNNAPSNLFPSVWNTWFEAEMRQPLLQGAGTDFNRIAGASNIPGLYNGVLVARVNTDVELTEFEMAVRDLVSNVENAYWDLYFGYRDLDARVAARDAALETWRRVHALYVAERRGGEAEKEAQAREQYYRFQEDVQNALSGRLVGGTSVNNGSSGGTFRASGGVQVAERRLRMLIGLPPSDGRLIRPADEPVTAPVHFDWYQISRESLVRRAELRRQRWMTRRYELEHIASKNYLLPRLDAVGLYRWRGFGDDLIHSDSTGRPRFDNAYMNLTSGDFQEWQLGMELNMPLGFRLGAAAVKNAELQLTRSRAILREQEHQVLHDAANAVAELDRAQVVAQTTAHRLDAARAQLSAVQAAFESEKAPLDLLLEAQRRLADAEIRHFQSLTEYAIAIKNVHYAKGTLLDYDGVTINESEWPGKAYADAAQREALRGKPRPLNYASARAPIVSNGPYDQHPMLEELVPAGEQSTTIEPIATPPGEPVSPPTSPDPTDTAPPLPAEPLAPVQPLSIQPPAKAENQVGLATALESAAGH
jgi:hypothetical protein